MRNRWYHAPVLHSHVHGAEKKPTWLELFYDLIFVASFIQLGNGLSDNVSPGGFAAFAGVFAPMWLAWAGMTYFINRFTIDDFLHRITVFLQMFAIGGMGVFAPRVLRGDFEYFAAATAVALAVISLLYLRAWRQVPEGRAYAKYWGTVFGIAALMWAISIALPTPYCYVAWALGALAIMTAPFSRHSLELTELFPTDHEHLSERFGLLTLIVLGESFVKVLSSLADGSGVSGLFQASLTLVITCSIWWIYFDDVAGTKLRRGKFVALIWLFGHLPLQIAITATGVAIKKIAIADFDAVAPAAYRWLLVATLALVMMSVALIDSVTARRQAELSDKWRVRARFTTALVLLLLAPAGGGMMAGTFIALVTAMCVAQVVFDMMMAPLEAMPEHAHVPSVADLVREQAEDTGATGTDKPAPRLRPRIGESVRKGTPTELRSDIYFYFMQGSWQRFFGALAFVYLVTNLIFAGLYFIKPGCISAANPESFADSFFFSVQTLSTIGYGSLSPATEYGNVIVTIEAAFGMLFVALATGLTFAKVSRATASILFSKSMVVANFHGVPTLSFRAGNARGNEIVDATMSVTALIDNISPEGHHMRRLHDLTLARSRSPIFSMTWVALHTIDEASPLHGCNFEKDGSLLAIIVTMIGHDGTYGQTVYARHQYFPEDVRRGHRFVDVIGQLPDGRMLVDYEKFHDTVPIDPVAPPS